MKVLELFSGLGHISDAFERRGHETYRVDWNEKLKANLHADIAKLTVDDLIKLCGGVPDVVWASPDCTTYSIATHRHRTLKEGLQPKTEYAKECDATNEHLWALIDELMRRGTKCYFVENPMGRMRHMPFVADRPRYTVDYCAYGSIVRKRTDIWTNYPSPEFKHCIDSHIHGHRQWYYGPKRDYLSRGEMPTALCDYIATISEEIWDE